MSKELIGQAFALATAITWAFALVLFRHSGRQIRPLPLNLFKCVVAAALFVVTVLLGPLVPGWLGEECRWPGTGWSAESLWRLIGSGVIGIAVADTLFFAALNRIGVGILSIVDCLYTPFVILCSWLLLPGDVLTWYHVAGAALVLSGVVVSSGHSPPANTTRGQLVAGILYGAGAMGLMALGIVMAKPAFDDVPLIWACLIRLVAGSAALAAIVAMLPDGRQLWGVFRPSLTWRTAVPAALLGSYLAYLFWMAGFKYANAAANAILNQTSIVFAIILATLVLREPFTRRKAVSVCLALSGMAVVMADQIATLLH